MVLPDPVQYAVPGFILLVLAEMVVARAKPALDQIITLAAKRPVAVFAHGMIGRVMRGLFLKAPGADILAMDQPQDAFFRLHRGEAARIAAASEAQ